MSGRLFNAKPMTSSTSPILAPEDTSTVPWRSALFLTVDKCLTWRSWRGRLRGNHSQTGPQFLAF